MKKKIILLAVMASLGQLAMPHTAGAADHCAFLNQYIKAAVLKFRIPLKKYGLVEGFTYADVPAAWLDAKRCRIHTNTGKLTPRTNGYALKCTMRAEDAETMNTAFQTWVKAVDACITAKSRKETKRKKRPAVLWKRVKAQMSTNGKYVNTPVRINVTQDSSRHRVILSILPHL